ncbi:MAG: hypothetical protein JW738_00060 [Actinobacteria bacterium]|nr:hypothetical protein [Actinomycetota bacterium]
MAVSKYEHLIPVVVEDLKVMTLEKCEKKHGISLNCLSGLIRDWKAAGKLPADYFAPSQRGYKRLSDKPDKFTQPLRERAMNIHASGTPPAPKVTITPERKPQSSVKIHLPPWNEAWGDSVKIEWLKSLRGANE